MAGVLNVWLLAWFLGTALASDSPAVRCDAVWLQPTKRCPLERSLAATGTGKDEPSARAAALDRMSQLVSVAAWWQELQVPARTMDPKACAEDVASKSRMSCAPATELTDTKTCFVSFSTPECIAVDPFELKGPAWKMMEKGREKICANVDRSHRTSAPIIQAQCLTRCLEEALVRCP